MCGIAGLFAYGATAPDVDRDELRGIRDHMRLRGPDASGEWFSENGRVAFGHRRLSIIDLSEGGIQPMHSADGRYVIVFNGEIYNYRALREQLQRKGRVFRSQSDTEVLLQLYAEHGAGMLGMLRGMFAFALWDGVREELVLARDPYGIKPLYYASEGGVLRFASQVKAIVEGGARVSRAVSPAAQVGFLMFGSVPEPHTWRSAVHAVPAGNWLRFARGEVQPITTRYFSLAQVWSDACGSAVAIGDLDEVLRTALRDSVQHHMVADVPVGAFLSAGIDSGALVGLMTEIAQQPIRTLTLSFDEFTGTANDEAPLAAAVARQYGTQHAERRVGRAELEHDLPAFFAAMDQPTIDGMNSWFVSKATHELGLKVAVSGLGGDELLGGYPSFMDLPRWVRLLRLPSQSRWLASGWLHAAGLLTELRPGLSPKLGGMLRYGGSYPGAYLLRRGLFMPWELEQVLPIERVREGLSALDPVQHVQQSLLPEPAAPYARVAALEAALYMRNQLLRDTDWASMAWSLEVRVPLVDATLLMTLAPLLAATQPGAGKQALARAPRPVLPPSVAGRAKTGFGTPIARWLEDSALLTRWRDVPALRRNGCHWSRRLAYDLACNEE